MPQPLISVRALIAESWSLFLQEWTNTLRMTWWLMLLPALAFVIGVFLFPHLLTLFVSSSTSAATIPILLLNLLFVLLFQIGTIIITLWVMVRLMRWALIKDRGGKPEPHDARVAWSNVLPIILIGLLVGLACFGGFVLFILPGIWLAVSLSYAQLLALEDGVWGTRALSASHALVKGRWWAVFGRVLAATVFSVIVMMIVINLCMLLLGLLVGSEKILLVLRGDFSLHPWVLYARSLIQSFWLVIFAPLFVIWQTKLFHSLKK